MAGLGDLPLARFGPLHSSAQHTSSALPHQWLLQQADLDGLPWEHSAQSDSFGLHTSAASHLQRHLPLAGPDGELAATAVGLREHMDYTQALQLLARKSLASYSAAAEEWAVCMGCQASPAATVAEECTASQATAADTAAVGRTVSEALVVDTAAKAFAPRRHLVLWLLPSAASSVALIAVNNFVARLSSGVVARIVFLIYGDVNSGPVVSSYDIVAAVRSHIDVLAPH